MGVRWKEDKVEERLTAMLCSDVISRATTSTFPSLALTMSIRPADALGSLAAATTLASDDRASWRTISRPIPLREGDPKRRQSRLAEAVNV